MLALVIGGAVLVWQELAKSVGIKDDPDKRVEVAGRLFEKACTRYGGRVEGMPGLDRLLCTVRVWSKPQVISLISHTPTEIAAHEGLELTSGRFDRQAAAAELRECRNSNAIERDAVRLERQTLPRDQWRLRPHYRSYSRRYGVCEE